MAVSDASQFTLVAGTTFAESALYTGVTVNSSGMAVLPNTTDTSDTIVGTLYSVTSTTASAGNEAVTIGYFGRVKVQMAASTQAAGDLIGFSTLGLGIVPTTDSDAAWGRIQIGSSGAAGRIHTVIRN